MNPELEELLAERDSWRRITFEEISRIPSGYLATYGRIAEKTNERGHGISARNVAWLRERLYQVLGHETRVPLHRVAKQYDVDSLHDSEETKQINDVKRRTEGFFAHPRWL